MTELETLAKDSELVARLRERASDSGYSTIFN